MVTKLTGDHLVDKEGQMLAKQTGRVAVRTFVNINKFQ